MSVSQSDELKDPALAAAVELARAAAEQEAGGEAVGEYVGAQAEGEVAVTHLFEADKPGYGGWRWAATLASAGAGTDLTVSEVVLLPGPDALIAPDWVPWENRVRAGDLGVGDLFPTAPDDPRLVPAYLASDDPAVEEVALEIGLGRQRVMARPAREDAAARWQGSEFGPGSDMARSAPAHCGTCGFYLPLAGSLRAAFGTCGNEISPADGRVVHAEYGCGAHSEAEVEQVSPVLVADLIYDDALLDVEPLEPEVPGPRDAPATADDQPETAPAEAGTDAAVTDAAPAVSAVSTTDETGSEPETATETAAAEPAAVEPAAAAPAEAETTDTEPAKAERAAVEPAAAEPTGTEPAAVEPTAAETAEVEPAEVEPAVVVVVGDAGRQDAAVVPDGDPVGGANVLPADPVRPVPADETYASPGPATEVGVGPDGSEAVAPIEPVVSAETHPDGPDDAGSFPSRG